MAIETRRGCGYRKVGGLYLVGSPDGLDCHRLPLPVERCPTCDHGIKPARGWTWVGRELLLPTPCDGTVTARPIVQVVHLSRGVETPGRTMPIGPEETYQQWATAHCSLCPVCNPDRLPPRCGLLWVGENYYATPECFLDEARELGISRRIAKVPRAFTLGETWVMLGHRLAIRMGGLTDCLPTPAAADDAMASTIAGDALYKPGIVSVFKPLRVELILRQSDATPERIAAEAKAGVTVVPVPDDDPDHNPAVERQGVLGLEDV